MARKMQIVLMSLMAICVLSLSTARITEAKTPAELLDELQDKLDKIITKATNNRDNLSAKVDTKVTKFNNGDINRNKFCKKINQYSKQSGKKRAKFNKKITKKYNKYLKKIQNAGGDSADEAAALAKRDAAQDEKEGLYDVLDDEIADAKNEPASPCT